MRESLAGKVRELIAGHFGISPDRLTDNAHLKADRLDRLELMIAIEDAVAGLEINDAMVEQIETVGDLMRVIGAPRGAS